MIGDPLALFHTSNLMQKNHPSGMADALIGWGVVAFFVALVFCAAVFGWDLNALSLWAVGLLLVGWLLFIPTALLLWLMAWVTRRR